MQNKQPTENLAAHFTEEELAKLYNYPSIGHLYSEMDTRRFDEFRLRLKTTRENIERVLRHGDRADAERAKLALRAVEVTLEFLDSLEKTRR